MDSPFCKHRGYFKTEMRRYLFSILLIMQCFMGLTQTVGLLSFDPSQADDGLTLLYPHNQSTVFLLDPCGQVVHSWPDSSQFRPGNVAYLLEDGSLLKTKRRFDSNQDPIWFGGGGEIVECRTWDNELLWQKVFNDSIKRIHHDIEPMPNGHVLLLAWEHISIEEAAKAGRDTSQLTQDRLLPDFIMEYSPSLDSIVWEWHAMDHLIQDHDAIQANFGVVREHPELIDFNFDTREGLADWMHSNSIDYHPELDQILLSVPHFNEIWIIDHGTTVAEASSHTGGRYGRGGDLLFRWGNPQAYDAGSAEDQKLFFQHDARWINEFDSEDHPYLNMISVFNNRVNELFSTVDVIGPEYSGVDGGYLQDDKVFLPLDFVTTLKHPMEERLRSSSVSGAQFLENGSALICSGRTGYIFELTSDNSVVWEYRVPLIGGQPVSQGTTIDYNQNFTFRMNRYPAEFEGFENKLLESRGPIELDSPDPCMLVPAVEEKQHSFKLYPNPASSEITLSVHDRLPALEIIHISSLQIYFASSIESTNRLDCSDWPRGLYVVKGSDGSLQRLVLH